MLDMLIKKIREVVWGKVPEPKEDTQDLSQLIVPPIQPYSAKVDEQCERVVTENERFGLLPNCLICGTDIPLDWMYSTHIGGFVHVNCLRDVLEDYKQMSKEEQEPIKKDIKILKQEYKNYTKN